MLDLIRKKQKSTLVKLVFWLIIATFVGTIFLVWGKGDERGPDSQTVAVSVNGVDVSTATYKSVYDNIYRFYQNIYGNSFNAEMEKLLQIPQVAYDQIVRQLLLIEEGERIGVSVSGQEVVDAIAKIPTFQVNGNFDRNTYVQVLSYQRITTDEFEADQERTLLMQKTEEALKAGVTVTDADIEEEFIKQNEKVNLDYVSINPVNFEKNVKVTDDALETFFAENQEQFRAPARISLRYLQFDPARYVDELTLEESEIEKYYRRNLDLFVIEEQVTASHILIKVDQAESEEKKAEKRELAEKVLAKVNAGEDFAALAREYSDDTGSAAKGGDLGSFGRGTMVPEFEQTAFSLNPGEISELVETTFGLHIIKVIDYVAPGEQPLVDVMDEVKAGLRVQKSDKYAFEKAMDAYNINRKTGDLEKAAAEFNLGVKETGLFTNGQSIDGIGIAPEISDAAFALRQGELAKPISHKDGIFLVTLKERQDSHIPELSTVRPAVEIAYRKQESKVLAEEASAQLLAELKEGKKLSSLAKGVKSKVEQTDSFTRAYGNSIPRIGESEKLATTAFELTAEAPVAPEVYEIGGRFIVATLKDKEEADLTKLDDAKREELKQTVQTAMSQELLDGRIDTLKKDAEIILSAYLISLGVAQ